MKNLVIAETFYSASKAHIAKGVLEEEGIESMIADETSAQVLSLTVGLGGIRLMVDEENLEKAKELISQMDL